MTYNKKSISPVISFLIWLVVFAVICIVGISNVFAASYNANSFTAQLYDNYGPSLHDVTTEFSNMSWRGTIPHMSANTSGAAWGISSPIPLLSNHTYSMTVKIEGTYGGNIILSTYNRIGVGTSLSNAKSSYENNTNCTLNYSNSISSNMTLQFAFTPTINSNYIVFPFATTYTGDNQSFYLYDIIIDDLGSSGVNETTINNSLNNQTNELNSSISNSTNIITGEINDMEQSIIDSNKETQEVIKDQFNTCRDSYNLFDSYNWYETLHNINSNDMLKTTIDGKEYYKFRPNTIWNIPYMKGQFKSNTQYTLSAKARQFDNIENYSTGIVFVYTDGTTTSLFINKTFEEYDYNLTSEPNKTIDYIRLMYAVNNYVLMRDIQLVEGTSSKPYEEYGKQVCTNKLDEQNETSKGIFGKIKELFAWLTNPDDADISGASDVAGWLPAGPLDSLINLPLTMLTNISNSLNKTCSPLNVNLPYVNKSVEIPCLNTIFNQITGLNSFWTWVGMIGSVLILYRYLINLYKYYDKLTDLQANFISDWGSI